MTAGIVLHNHFHLQQGVELATTALAQAQELGAAADEERCKLRLAAFTHDRDRNLAKIRNGTCTISSREQLLGAVDLIRNFIFGLRLRLRVRITVPRDELILLAHQNNVQFFE